MKQKLCLRPKSTYLLGTIPVAQRSLGTGPQRPQWWLRAWLIDCTLSRKHREAQVYVYRVCTCIFLPA